MVKRGVARPDRSFVPLLQVRIMCPNLVCRKVLAVPESLRNKTVRCKNCGTNIKVPPKVVAPVALPVEEAGKTAKKAA